MGRLIIAALVALLLVLAYLANQRARYIDLFRAYGVYRGEGCPDPWKIALAIEHPWMQQVFMSRPITTPVAQFALYLLRGKGAELPDLCLGFLRPGQSLTAVLGAFTASQGAWENSANPLATRFAVPFDAPIVNLYNGTPLSPGAPSFVEKLPLEVLYGAGFLSLASLETTAAATSLEDLWRLCFSEQIPSTLPPAPPPASQCDSAGSHALSGALGGAGIGAMIGAFLPIPFLGSLIGGLIGGLGGGIAGVATNNGACCLAGSCPDRSSLLRG